MKYKATSEQIRLIKAAIKLHDMRGITWQSVATRPDSIEQFLTDTGMRPKTTIVDAMTAAVDCGYFNK